MNPQIVLFFFFLIIICLKCTSDGYWTILETVPYSLQNNTTNAAGSISSVANTQMSGQHHQSIQAQDDGNSTETDLIASATMVVEIPSESMRSAIKYTIPETNHQLIQSSDRAIAASGSKQRIHIVKDVRLNHTVSVAQQSTIAASNVELSNRQHTTQPHLQQHFTLNDCLSTGVVVQQHHTQRQRSDEEPTEFIKIESIPEKMILRNVIEYDSVAVAAPTVDVVAADASQVVSSLVADDKQQRQLQQQQQEVLRNTRQLELLDKGDIEAVSDTVLNAYQQQQEHVHEEEQSSQTHEHQGKLVPLMRYPAKILAPATTEAGLQLQYVCNLCGKSYKIKGSLKRHKRYECGVAPTVACAFCPHKCKYKSDLRKHVSQKHMGQSSDELLLDN